MQAASCWELLFKACTISRMFDTGCGKNKKVTFHKEPAPKASSTENMTILPHEANTLHPGLWRSFANKRLQSFFPSSYRKKKMTISEPSILRNPEEIQELPTSSSSDDQKDDTHSLLMTAVVKEKHSWETFTYQEISLVTNNFDPENPVGKGWYAKVYKGVLPCGQLIAFSQHGNLQVLLHSHNGPTLEWVIRYKMVIGVAQGLQYLHEICHRHIIHGDVKASNILLGPDFERQLCLPMNLSKSLCMSEDILPGYLAPEYHMHGIVNEKTDVFSYRCALLVAALCVCQSTVWQPSMSQVIQLLRLQETSYMVKADHLKRLMFRLHDFQYAAMDDDQQQEQQEEYSRSEESWLAVSSGSSNGI
ncbi:unnamed protein product [Sphagnum jensenii]|uniref:Protein kinase domain-containing protein n=1 Tax=Sphagnum jensenii TaxID=128206 RepID=A0ABP1ALV9_9BRYO